MISNTLEKLGFSNKEMEVYLAIVRAGKISHSSLSRATRINRSTVYSIVNSLGQKGVITEDLGGKVTYVRANPIEDLTVFIDKEEKELRKRKQLVHQAIDELHEISKGQEYSVPKIRFIEEENLEDFLYKQTSVWAESILNCDGVWWGFQDSSFVENYEDWIDWTWEKSPKNASEVKLLSNEKAEKIKGKKYKNRHIKFWNRTKNFSATTWVMGDYVVMIVTNKHPHYCLEIYDKTLAHNNREIFKNLWVELGFNKS